MDGRSCALLITSAPLPHIVGAFSLPIFALLSLHASFFDLRSRHMFLPHFLPFFARLRSPLRPAVAVGAVRQSVRTVRDFPRISKCRLSSDLRTMLHFFSIGAERMHDVRFFHHPSICRLRSDIRGRAMLHFFIILFVVACEATFCDAEIFHHLRLVACQATCTRRTMLCFFSISLLAKLHTSQNRRRDSVFRLHPCTLVSFVPHRITKPRCRVVPNPAHWLHSTPTHARMHVYTHAFGEIFEKNFYYFPLQNLSIDPQPLIFQRL